jgi:hypothetical protein
MTTVKDNNDTIIINSEEDLQGYFHSVHSFIRNRFGLYGKAALQFFNFFFVLKVIEPLIENKTLDFNQNLEPDDEDYIDCRFSVLCNMNNEELKIERTHEIKKRIFNSEHKETFFMNFPLDRFDVKKQNLTNFLNKLNVLTPEIMDQYHVYGRVYEYFLGHITGRNSGSRSGSQMEDLGQFFTSRHLVRYCIAKVKPTIENDIVPKMGDFYCGSGGFITEYIRYLNYHNNIDWTDNIDNIYGFDTDAEILKSARVDIMTLTNSFYKEKKDDDDDEHTYVFKNNFRNVNTFEENCDNMDNQQIRVNFNFTNPPYGNSGKTTDEDKIKLSGAGKEIKHVAMYGSINNNKITFKPTKSKPFMINGDNKETISILHGMGVLAKDGIYCGVLKEGCFFDKKFQDLRTNLCKFYEVQYVISVPQDDFLNTSTKTSILIFKNSGKATTEIKFCELDIIKSDNKIIGFNEINSQTKQTVNTFTSSNYEFVKKDGDYLRVEFDELEKNGFSFNFKNYIKEEIKVGTGFKVVRLGDILIYQPKSKRKAGDETEDGLFRFYTSSDKIKKCSFLDFTNKLCLIIGTGGKGSLFIDTDFSCSADNFVCQTDDENLTWYIYYYLKHNWDKFIYKMFNGSTLGHVNKENLNNYDIPIPESIETIKLYLDYLGPANQTLQTLQTLQTQKEASICGKIKLLTMMGTEGVDYDEYKLGDIITTKPGKFNTKNMSNTGEYPFYNASVNNPIGTHNEYCFDGGKYLLFIKSGGNANNKISTTNGLALPLLCSGKIASVIDAIKIDSKHNIDYLYYYLIMKRPLIQDNAKFTVGLGHVDMEYFKNLPIRILKSHLIQQYKLDDDFIFMDKLRNDIQNTLKLQEDTTKQMMSLVLSPNHMNNNNDTISGSDTISIPKDNDNVSETNSNESDKLSVFHEEIGIDHTKLIVDLDDVKQIDNEIKTKKINKKLTSIEI